MPLYNKKYFDSLPVSSKFLKIIASNLDPNERHNMYWQYFGWKPFIFANILRRHLKKNKREKDYLACKE